MEEFKESEVYNLILNEHPDNPIFEFKSYNDGIFSYYTTKEDVKHELCVICDDVLLSKMSLMDIVNLKRITYFSASAFLESEIIGSVCYP